MKRKPHTERKTAPVDLVWNGEMLFDAGIEDVWRHLINYSSWQDYSVVQHVSGEAGQEGEVVLLNKVEPGFTFPAYFARTIKLEPPRRVIWKTYPQSTEPDIDFSGIIEFRLNQEGPQTR